MPGFASKLVERDEVAEATMAFAFERPAGFDFTAGQNLTLTLPQPLYNDEKGSSRTFTIASPPQERERLLIATRMTGSAFKRSLAEMPLGAPVSIIGPAGTFTLAAAADTAIVFIAGGIGITPFRSMILDAAARRLPHQITLVYSNRTPEGAAFHEELARLAAQHRSFRYLPTMTQAASSRQPWHGETRMIDATFLREQLGGLSKSASYVAGPPGLVAAVTQAVLAAGADPTRLHTEEFAGYGPAKAPVAQAPSPSTTGFVRVASTAELASGQMIAVEVDGTRIALCNVEGEFYAIADECPHAGASLSEGELIGKELTCPRHGAIFDVTTGEVLAPPADEAVPCYQVRISGDAVEVELRKAS